MNYKKADHFLLWFLIAPALGYAFWTKWAVVHAYTPLPSVALLDFARLHLGYYLAPLLWCILLLRPAPGLIVFRLLALVLTLVFITIDLGYSAAIFYTGTLAPYDVSWYAGKAVGLIPLPIPAMEILILLALPLTCLALALWKLHQLRQQGNLTVRWPIGAGLLLLLLTVAYPPVAPALELNRGRAAYVYQIMEYLDDKSFWPQLMAGELNDQPLLTPSASTSQPVLQDIPDKSRPNLVIIALESVGANAVGLYNPARKAVTPFLNQLADDSLVVQNAFTVVPHTSKALTGINCGVFPFLKHPIFESTFGPEQPCLAELLQHHGYGTAFFQSPTEHFENRRGLVKQLGFEYFQGGDQLDKAGFQLANYFGYEDNILLQPGLEWIQAQHRPFFAFYLTGTTHHPYWLPQRYPEQSFVANPPELNDYLNAVHYLDHFVENLMAQYKEIGIYENTIFVIVGDHGESFGDLHYRKQHNVNLYQEVMQVPLLIHAPGIIASAPRIELASQLDIMPTLLHLLRIPSPSALAGVNMLNKNTARTTAIATCWYDDWCMASTNGHLKLIHNFNQKADELYDLQNDPAEQQNIIGQHKEWATARLHEMQTLLKTNRQRWHQRLSSQDPDYWNKRDDTLGTPARLLQLAQDDPRQVRRAH